MPIITLARQVGSGGHSIAAYLAGRLGYAVVGRRELREAVLAHGADLPEAFANFADEDYLSALATPPRIGDQMYLSYGELEFDHQLRGAASGPMPSDAAVLDRLDQERATVFLLVQAAVFEAAARGNIIIVGAGSQWLLADLPGVLRVKITAPRDIRAGRLAAAYQLAPTAAHQAVERGDQEQVAYNRLTFDLDWEDPLLWDLVINSEQWDVAGIGDLIISAIHQPRFAKALPEPMASALVFASQIDIALHLDPALSGAMIYATPLHGRVQLDGQALSAAQATRAEEIARQRAGAMPVISAIDVLERSAAVTE